jgi:periplasmic divalent cation tolerance protein
MTTVEDDLDAKKLADALIRNKLAACVQFTKTRSVYRWKDNIQSSQEYVINVKTRRELAPKVIDFIKENHTYEVPEIVVLPILTGYQPYLDWIQTETAE